MRSHTENIIRLIEDSKLTEAMDILKLEFAKGERVSKEKFALLYRIVSEALEKNDVKLAVNAAAYGEGFFGFIEVPKSASWNAIIHKANQLGPFPTLPFRSVFLTPERGSNTPCVLRNLAVDVWKLGRDHHWEIPECEVIFDAPSSDSPILLQKVSSIRGKYFAIGYGCIQGLASGDWHLNDTAGFDWIAINGFVMNFYSDGSGPTILKYSGDHWEEEIAGMVPSYTYIDPEKNPDWSKVELRIPMRGEIFVDHLFESGATLAASMEHHRRSGQEIKDLFVNKAIAALRDRIIPRIHASIPVVGIGATEVSTSGELASGGAGDRPPSSVASVGMFASSGSHAPTNTDPLMIRLMHCHVRHKNVIE